MEKSLEQRYVIKFCVRLQKSASENFEMVREVFNDEAISRASIFHWHKAFKKDMLNVEDIELGTTVNGSYYANVLRTIEQHVKRKRPLLRNDFLLHHDNARPYIARCVLDVLQ
ncbi:histone-lysine N-methyltransferase SETMAR [Trichonephila clavata]|uniref:Histone-lysine N-methyltransferase SETMAR n=1 Tax=Trichonephila clavata TaxID=2740835 RepID=A0A8X6L6D3_TRICU|nr:histone-lysine N-methyltransferase SETMAR [Trichonephila clavata]